MPFSEEDRYNIFNCLELTQDDITDLWLKIDATEARSEFLVVKCQEILAKFDTADTSYTQSGTDDAGMNKADVLEWDSTKRMHQIIFYKNNLKNRLARLIGYPISNIENNF